MRGEILEDLGARKVKDLGEEYSLVRLADTGRLHGLSTAPFVRWKLPLVHSWPCHPRKMDGFVEKAATTIREKFPADGVQGIFVGRLDPGSRDGYYKALAMKLRGRILQLFGEDAEGFVKVEEQDPKRPSLFCMVGQEGLFCGVGTPEDCNGFHPGGTKYISQKAPHSISRAGAKIAEALHHLKLHRPLPGEGAHWLELGASPGGMSSELLEHGYQVTAIDRAPLDKRLDGRPGLRFIKADVASFKPARGSVFEGLLCDMNGESGFALDQVIRLSENLSPGGVAIFTLKTRGTVGYLELAAHYKHAMDRVVAGRMRLIAATHLTYNRQEFTLFIERDADLADEQPVP